MISNCTVRAWALINGEWEHVECCTTITGNNIEVTIPPTADLDTVTMEATFEEWPDDEVK
jgi:hypothetical protein